MLTELIYCVAILLGVSRMDRWLQNLIRRWRFILYEPLFMSIIICIIIFCVFLYTIVLLYIPLYILYVA